MSATVWNAGQKSGNITLSGGGLVATSAGAGGVRSDHPLSGLSYFESVITTLAGTPQIGIASFIWGNTTALGANSYSIGYLSSGAVQINSTTVATLAAYVQGDRVEVAVNPADRLIWFRVNGGNWNNNVANDPVTSVGGIDYSATMTFIGTMYAAVYASITGTVWTTTFSTPFTDSAPTNYQSLDVAAYTKADANDPRDGMPGSVPASFGFRAEPVNGKAYSTLGKHFTGTSITTVSGVLKELGVPVGGRRVDVYDRLTGELLGTTTSAGDGTWSVPCLGRPSVRIVASDPTAYNSLAFDNVIPG